MSWPGVFGTDPNISGVVTNQQLAEVFSKMAGHDIIVVGASAGGVPALREFAAGLPPDLAVSIFVVLHIPPWARSELPSILTRSGPFSAIHPSEDQVIEPGIMYIAPPDRHLLISDHRTNLWRGPKENLHRPSINTLFRSAAVAYGGRVVGIILSGALDDGTTGLWWIKRHGGICIVQDPLEAAYPDMPQSALEHVAVDYTLRVSQMGAVLRRLANGGHTKIKAAEARQPEQDGDRGNQTEY